MERNYKLNVASEAAKPTASGKPPKDGIAPTRAGSRALDDAQQTDSHIKESLKHDISGSISNATSDNIATRL